jgi:CubicO group peptidase (beta-lactamase class C family)
VGVPELRSGAVYVANGDDVLLEVYTGVADARSGARCDASTRFQISSISKQFVAVSILLLANRGSLSVDDQVAAWFPSSPPSWNLISIANLMTHTAGLGHWPDYAAIDPARSISDAEFVAALQQRPLPVELPTLHLYSSPGYGLLARIVERASGLNYPQFIRDNIFDPLGMRESYVGNANERPYLARGFLGDVERSSWELDSTNRGAGDIWATARDLDRWDRGLLSNALLPVASTALMFCASAPIVGLPLVTGYGFGWLVGEINGQPVYAHPGDNPGYQCFNAILPKTHGRVILLSNEETADVFTPAIGLLEALAGES